MRLRLRHRILCVLACAQVAMAGGVAKEFAQSASVDPVVVATYAYPGRDRVAAIEPLAGYLGEQLQRPVRVQVLPSPTALVRAMQAGDVDVAVPNLFGYLLATRPPSMLAPLPVPDVPAMQADRYRSVIVARRPMTLAHVAVMAGGLRLALVGADSASGGLVPLAGLRQAGVGRADFAAVRDAGSHAAALQALVEEEVDVAALAADVFDAGNVPGLHVVWRSAVIPPGPLLCRPSPQLDCMQLRSTLLAVDDDHPTVMEGLRAGWPEFGDARGFVDAPAGPLLALARELPQTD